MGKTVMIVDDSKSTRTMVSFTLRRAGKQETEAEDGGQALRLLGERAPDCVITDLNMPGMDGLELIRSLRGAVATRATPILMLTTSADTANREAGERGGANGWLAKPFTPATLVEAVARLI
jgi:two-component system chemotaxis response regulator CheY